LFNTTAYIIIVLHLMLIVYGTGTRYHHRFFMQITV